MTSNFQYNTFVLPMRLRLIKLILLFVFITVGCGEKSGTSDSRSENERSELKYRDGTFCAGVTYYNPSTGTRHTYKLNVEVEDNELTMIHWPNGGWLDDSHFTPVELDNDGSCSFTSDRGYQFDIQITGPECSYTDFNKVQNDLDDEIEKVTCPKCGGEKETYEQYCYSCTQKIKDQEEHTCPKCGNYDPFMFSVDTQCSDCKRKEEDEKRRKEENDDYDKYN